MQQASQKKTNIRVKLPCRLLVTVLLMGFVTGLTGDRPHKLRTREAQEPHASLQGLDEAKEHAHGLEAARLEAARLASRPCRGLANLCVCACMRLCVRARACVTAYRENILACLTGLMCETSLSLQYPSHASRPAASPALGLTG